MVGLVDDNCWKTAKKMAILELMCPLIYAIVDKTDALGRSAEAIGPPNLVVLDKIDAFGQVFWEEVDPQKSKDVAIPWMKYASYFR